MLASASTNTSLLQAIFVAAAQHNDVDTVQYIADTYTHLFSANIAQAMRDVAQIVAQDVANMQHTSNAVH